MKSKSEPAPQVPTGDLSYQQEVRFAVVMYGGVSLAIYINGVAQELLSLVRATTPRSPSDRQLTATEDVYRKAAFLLSGAPDLKAAQDHLERGDEPTTRFVIDIISGTSAGGINGVFLAKALANRQDMNNLKQMWIREGDIAKLLNDRKSAEPRLKVQDPPTSLLSSQRIYAELLNALDGMGEDLPKAAAGNQNPADSDPKPDVANPNPAAANPNPAAANPKDGAAANPKPAAANPNPAAANPKDAAANPNPAAANQNPAAANPEAAPNPKDGAAAGNPNQDNASKGFVDEVDLYVTATDLAGLVVPIRLADELVYERRYKNVFHFRYSAGTSPKDAGGNQFEKEYNPFLAFAARCTSSFPGAFEPMQLEDIDPILESRGEDSKKIGSDNDLWKIFYREYLNPVPIPGKPLEFPKRSFGDGGYLDNKPFTYAIAALARRQANVPVIRKLVYVEPSPEHPEDVADDDTRPNIVQNVMDALLKLPLYQAIRDDLKAVTERNRMIERINQIIDGVDHDASLAREAPAGTWGVLDWSKVKEPWAQRNLTDEEWAKLDLADMIKRRGREYVGYHRLEIASVTDDLAALVARVAGLNEDSDYFLITRALVRAWRDQAYTDYHKDAPEKPTLNQFLHEFDLSYALRRINFLLRKIDQLYCLDEKALKSIQATGFWAKAQHPDQHDKKTFRDALIKTKSKLSEQYFVLRNAGRSLRVRPGAAETARNAANASPVHDQITDLVKAIQSAVERAQQNAGDAEFGILPYFLKNRAGHPPSRPTDDEVLDRARTLLTDQALEKLFQKTAGAIRDELKKSMGAANEKITALLKLDADAETAQIAPGQTADEAVVKLLRDCYHSYDSYDMIAFPVLYGTDIGEAAKVDVVRISPEDAKCLIDERPIAGSVLTPCLKLAGTALGHFGAFMEQRWRENDILWGRLDGAERLLTMLISDPVARAELIGEAQANIVLETISSLGPVELKSLLAESAMRPRPSDPAPEILGNFLTTLKAQVQDDTTKAKLDLLINDREIRQHYINTFADSHSLDPGPALESAARATTVIGKILSGLAGPSGTAASYTAWIARIGQIFWALVEIAVPRRFPNIIFRHALKLLYFLEVLLIVVSTLLLNPPTQKFGFLLLAITAAIHITVNVLADIMAFRNRWLRIAKWAAITLVLVVFVIGAICIAGVLGAGQIWAAMSTVQGWLSSGSALANWPTRIGISVTAVAFFLVVIRDDLRRSRSQD
ncbi:MAG TPA: patatin-like protein [Blastocatellia bacterium]